MLQQMVCRLVLELQHKNIFSWLLSPISHEESAVFRMIFHHDFYERQKKKKRTTEAKLKTSNNWHLNNFIKQKYNRNLKEPKEMDRK